MATRGVAAGTIEGWRLRADLVGADPPRYRVSPGGRFATAPGALLDRSTGQQYSWPAEQLWLRVITSDLLLPARRASPSGMQAQQQQEGHGHDV